MVAEYIDEDEPFRKEKERQIVEEGRSVRVDHLSLSPDNNCPELLSTDLSGIARNRRSEIFCSGMLTS